MSRSYLPLAAFSLSLALLLTSCQAPEPPPGASEPLADTASATTVSTTAADAATEPTAAAAGELVVYSGRSEELVAPLVEQFEAASGIDVAVRYGDTAELAATILEEGANAPADVYWAQDAGALGALAKAGRLAPLAAELLDRVPAQFRAKDGSWVGTSGRARVLVYNTEELTPADLPTELAGLTDPRWRGRIGWAPTNGSFQSFVTALRRVAGEEQARAWLKAMQANEPQAYESNAAIVEAVANGEVALGLVNHYYLYRFLAERGADLPVANHHFPGQDVGNLVNIAGAGVLDSAKHPEAAAAFIQFLLSDAAQAYFATETVEYPLAAGAKADARLPALDRIAIPDIDLSDLDDLAGTLKLLQELGIL